MFRECCSSIPNLYIYTRGRILPRNWCGTFTRRTSNYLIFSERKLLAFVWSLKLLRHYLYGIESLNFSIFDKNPNSKINRWKAFIKCMLQPRRDNMVANALSRQFLNMTMDSTSSDSIQAYASEISSIEVIPTVENPADT